MVYNFIQIVLHFKKYLSRREDFLKKGAKYSLHHIHTSNTHSFNSTFRYLLEDFTTELYPYHGGQCVVASHSQSVFCEACKVLRIIPGNHAIFC